MKKKIIKIGVSSGDNLIGDGTITGTEEEIKEFLKENGKIIITTPNKSYFSKKSIWRTDLPPIHLFWFSKRSFKKIAEICNLNYEFVDFSNYSPYKENKFFNYLSSRFRRFTLPKPFLNEKGEIFEERKNPFKERLKLIIKKMFFSSPLKNISNIILKLIKLEGSSLGVILSKRTKERI